MVSQRTIISLFVLATIVALVHSATPNDVIVGSPIYGARLIQREFIKVPSKWWQTVKFSKTFTGDGRSNITQVKLFDQNKKGNGANAVIANGGPGYSYVTADFKSKSGHSIDFVVEIYGK